MKRKVRTKKTKAQSLKRYVGQDVVITSKTSKYTEEVEPGQLVQMSEYRWFVIAVDEFFIHLGTTATRITASMPIEDISLIQLNEEIPEILIGNNQPLPEEIN